MSRFSNFLTKYLYLTGRVGVCTSFTSGIYVGNKFYEESVTLQDKVISTTIGAIEGASTGFILGTMGTITAPIIIPTLCANLVLDKVRNSRKQAQSKE
jgi:hypothetical protein